MAEKSNDLFGKGVKSYGRKLEKEGKKLVSDAVAFQEMDLTASDELVKTSWLFEYERETNNFMVVNKFIKDIEEFSTYHNNDIGKTMLDILHLVITNTQED